MSVDRNYVVEFKEIPSLERLLEVKFRMIDIFGSDIDTNMLNKEDILIPIKIGKNSEYEILELETLSSHYLIKIISSDYSIGYERGNFIIHYLLPKFFLSQDDVNIVYSQYLLFDGIGKEVTKNDIEELAINFFANGYSIREEESPLNDNIEFNPTHPACFCKRKLFRTSTDEKFINFLCTANGCNMPPLRLTGKSAELWLKNGSLPKKYREVEEDGLKYWTQNEDNIFKRLFNKK